MDLSAAKMTEFSDRVVSIGSEKILPVAAIYGAISALKSIDIFKGAQCPVDIGLAPTGVERRQVLQTLYFFRKDFPTNRQW